MARAKDSRGIFLRLSAWPAGWLFAMPSRCAALSGSHPQELKTKKRYGRLQKAMGDHCLLAGSPLDAQDHYSTGGPAT